MNLATGQPSTRKTYSRLRTDRRLPTEYEVVSTDLHYNYPDAFELTDTSVIDWYRRHREGSKIRSASWGSFNDPRRTTYRSYTEMQDKKENVIDGLFRQIDEDTYDDDLSDGWIEFLDHWYAPLRYPGHGLQMLAAYVGHLAPASQVTNCAAFQAADEMRRVQRIAYRTAQLADHRPNSLDLTEHGRRWEEESAYQPLRELIERAWLAYDWAEALVVTNLVIKPLLDRLINEELAGHLADINHDPILKNVHFSLDEDARWHRKWSGQLIRRAIIDNPANTEVVSTWIDTWRPIADEAVRALAGVLGGAPNPGDPDGVVERVEAAVSAETRLLLETPPANPEEG